MPFHILWSINLYEAVEKEKSPAWAARHTLGSNSFWSWNQNILVCNFFEIFSNLSKTWKAVKRNRKIERSHNLLLIRGYSSGPNKHVHTPIYSHRGKSAMIESIYFAESSGLSCWETEREVLLPTTQHWERRHSYNTQQPKWTCQGTCSQWNL